MTRLTPNLATTDVRASVEYYVKHFGFEIFMAVDAEKSAIGKELVEGKTYVWANVMHGDVGLMFQAVDAIQEDVGAFFDGIGSSATLYIEVEDAEALYETVRKEVEILKPIDTTWYGQREFYVRDLNGYVLGFATAPSKQ
jgi:uncharacterized glyoxalase superfamily protein PhnB